MECSPVLSSRLLQHGHRTMPLSPEEYARLSECWATLFAALQAEELFEQVLDNHLDHESELLRTDAASAMAREPDVRRAMNAAARWTTNVLASCNQYLSLVMKHAKDIAPDLQRTVDDERRRLYAESPSYQFGYELRNHSQHSGLPITGASFRTWIIDKKDHKAGYLHCTELFADLKDFEASFTSAKNRAILRRMREIHGPQVNIRTIVKDYVGCICALQQFIRKHAQPRIDQAVADFRSIAIRYNRRHPGVPFKHLYAANGVGDSVNVGTILVFQEWHRDLKRRNRGARPLSGHVVISKRIDALPNQG